MTLPAWIVLGILLVAFILLVTAWLKPDIVALLVLVALVLTRVIDPSEAFAGFSSFAVVTIAGLMVIGHGLERTGLVKWVARQFERMIHKRYNRLLLLNTGVPGVLSGFVNIVATAHFFSPVILRLCKQMKVSQSRVLLPMVCTSLIGANLTLIGASHNLVVDSLLAREVGAGFGFFEFSIVGAVLLVAALVYIFTIGQRLLSDGRAADPVEVPVSANLVEVYGLEQRMFEIWVSEELQEGQKTVGALALLERGLMLIAIARESEQLVLPHGDLELSEGDMLLIQGREELVEQLAEEREGLTFVGPPKTQIAYPVSTAELAEAVVPPRSPAIGQMIRELGLIEQFGMTVIAYYRDGAPHRTNIQDAVLREGDSLLVYGPRERMRDFNPEKELLIYFKPGEPEVSVELKGRAPIAASILVLVVLAAALGWMPIAVTAVTGAVAMVLLGIVRPERVYHAIDVRALILIGGMYPLGIALNVTGAADVVGEVLVAALGGFGPLAVLAGITALCMVLTQPIHNAAVAIIMTPIAINAATLMGSNPRAFCVAVIVACSAVFLMPYGHPAPFMVLEPGGYTARDYLRFGFGLMLIVFVVILGLIPLFWAL